MTKAASWSATVDLTRFGCWRRCWIAACDSSSGWWESFGIEQVRVRSLRAIQRLVLLAAVAMVLVIWLCEHGRRRHLERIEDAALHFTQAIVYRFCRIAAGLRNLLTVAYLQPQLAGAGYG